MVGSTGGRRRSRAIAIAVLGASALAGVVGLGVLNARADLGGEVPLY
jgi:hypothetical protein